MIDPAAWGAPGRKRHDDGRKRTGSLEQCRSASGGLRRKKMRLTHPGSRSSASSKDAARHQRLFAQPHSSIVVPNSAFSPLSLDESRPGWSALRIWVSMWTAMRRTVNEPQWFSRVSGPAVKAAQKKDRPPIQEPVQVSDWIGRRLSGLDYETP